MNKIIFLSIVIVSILMLPTYAFDETDDENLTGSAVKILNKYQGSWKGWSDGCVNCDQPLASDKRVAKAIAKKKVKTKSKAKVEIKESKKQDKNKDNLIQPMPKSLRRGYCGCSCGDKSTKNSETNCTTANDTNTSMNPDRTVGSTSEHKKSNAESEQTIIKKDLQYGC